MGDFTVNTDVTADEYAILMQYRQNMRLEKEAKKKIYDKQIAGEKPTDADYIAAGQLKVEPKLYTKEEITKKILAALPNSISTEEYAQQQLMKDRNDTYGNTWIMVSWVLQSIIDHTNCPDKLMRIIEAGYFHNWFTILSKLMRLITTPKHLDSWLDISTYAKLCVEHIKDSNYQGGVVRREISE